jgi:hypothetical protein
VADRVRELASVVLDPDGFRAIVSELNRERDEGRPEPEGPGHPPAEVVLGPRATWIEAPSGERQKLGRALSRMVLALVERLRQGDAPLTTAELLEAGWPGEQPIFEAGQNRVYVSVNRLRGVGLREVLERSGDGYRLVPGTIVRIEGEPLGATPGATPDPASRRRRQRVSRA